MEKCDDREDIENIVLNGHVLPLSQFHADLHEWGTKHRRIFPWRLSTNAFHILIAELMLRRTHARQVVPVYNRFIALYPDAHSLAQANPADVEQILYSLGMAWRVPAFQQVAQALINQHESQMPTHYKELLSLPGVGDYVASAVACFAYGEAHPIIDINTVRIAGRLFGIPLHAESRRTPQIRSLLTSLLDQYQPQSYNYALLDLAASVCVPRNPACPSCPLLCYCTVGQSSTNAPL